MSDCGFVYGICMFVVASVVLRRKVRELGVVVDVVLRTLHVSKRQPNGKEKRQLKFL